jgi:hypothetical protein
MEPQTGYELQHEWSSGFAYTYHQSADGSLYVYLF